jgi:glycosyltransferase involved in cell wall biosynthesis
MYPAVDTSKLSAKIHFQSEKQFMWAGRIVAGKGADLAVDAVGLLKKRGIDVKLDLFGMGTPSERKAKRARIESLGLIDRVTMRGIRAGELSQHYVKYDALLYTARVPEPFSMTVLEASLSRLPCIVAKIGGNPELLTHGQNAVLFEAGSVEALADAMAGFLNREDGGEGLATHDFQRLHAEQDTDMFCDRIEAMLAQQSVAPDQS